ncbi:MAG: hypothetical protein KAR14_07360 [Candidatus Aminicenantes bacterium]|nr:hypothetical protein [Candidatus Aminicenantes bacterium]
MFRDLKEEEIQHLIKMLKDGKIKISKKEIINKLKKILDSQQIFPLDRQRMMLLKLIHNYDITKKKAVIILDEHIRDKFPSTIALGVLAEDWPGMSNSILGLIHHRSRNVQFIKGFTVEFKKKIVGIVILAFNIYSKNELDVFKKERKSLIKTIKEAAVGSVSKYILQDEEAVKSEIFSQILKRIKKIYTEDDIDQLINENGQVLKFVLSRTRKYLEERKTNDLADFILENFKCQKLVRSEKVNEIIKIKNFETTYEKLTGITFVCKGYVISIEDFLRTLDHIVPDHIIKHHKSFVSSDGLLVYRIEIVDKYGSQLTSLLTSSIEKSFNKIVIAAHNSRFSNIKSVGGFEHFARAIIPFLMDEIERTRITQVFLNVTNKTDFNIEIKAIIVRTLKNKGKILNLIPKIDKLRGVEISSFTPTKVYRDNFFVDLFKLKIDLSEFSSVRDIFDTLRETIKKEFGAIRDFDQGLRDINIFILTKLIDELKEIDKKIIMEIFFNFDEMFRIETNFEVMKEVVSMCYDLTFESKKGTGSPIFINSKKIKDTNKTIIIVSCFRDRSFLRTITSLFKEFNINFSKFYIDQRKYSTIIIDSNKDAELKSLIKELKEKIKGCI